MKYVFFLFIALFLPYQAQGASSSQIATKSDHVRHEALYVADRAFDYQACYNYGIKAYEEKRWRDAVSAFEYLVKRKIKDTQFKETYLADVHFLLGVSYYFREEYDFANEALSNYLKLQEDGKYFDQAFQFKFCIAEAFREGARIHLWNSRFSPCWASAYEMAIEIYDEIITTLPKTELGIQALYAKGCFLFDYREYEEAIATYQMLIDRFPKHELVPQSYLAIIASYRAEVESGVYNPDHLALAKMTVSTFHEKFPRQEELSIADAHLCALQESYARNLFSIGNFYEKVCKPQAAKLYYHIIVKKFPNTQVAEICRSKLGI